MIALYSDFGIHFWANCFALVAFISLSPSCAITSVVVDYLKATVDLLLLPQALYSLQQPLSLKGVALRSQEFVPLQRDLLL